MFVMEELPMSVEAEAYRTLRSNLQYSIFDTECKVIAITSANPQEGKSTIAGNIALALAQCEKKVILIDCDLRKPSLHKKFNLSNKTGITEIIIAKEAKIIIGEKYNEYLTIVTSGTRPPNPAELLGSRYMTNVLNALRKAYDYVILDTPPLEAVTDGQILAAHADGTILVVKAEATKKTSVHNAISMLKKVNARIIGVVLNEVKVKNSYYYDEDEN